MGYRLTRVESAQLGRYSRQSQPFPCHPFDGQDREEQEQGGGLVPERGLLGAGDLPGPGAEQGGELAGLEVGEDTAAGGAGEAVEGVARGGQLDAFGRVCAR